VDLARAKGVRAALTDALREGVRTGRLAPGTRLPPSRSFAADLGVARNTVAEAYGELVAEGWLTARQGSGTRVAPGAPGAPGTVTRTPRPASAVGSAPGPAAGETPHHRMTGAPDVSGFPRAAWLSAARRALAAAPNEAFGYGDPRGRPELRTALAGYLARARGVRADPERIVVCAGFVQGLMLLARALAADGATAMAVESYGLRPHRELITGAGLRTVPLPVDEHGARTGDLDGLGGVGAVLLTPAHQFPTGVPLHPDRRAAAVAWASGMGGLVLEDDYDGEFRYDRQPVGALQGLDPDRVVHLGTASKSLAPALRLGWMVLPEHLVERVVRVRGVAERQSGALDQLTLAEFIAAGSYDRHVRGMRMRYRRRRDQLVTALAEQAPRARVTGIAAGLHAVLRFPPGAGAAVLRRAERWERGMAVEGLDAYRYADPSDEDRDALVVGYGGPPEHAFAGALEALCATVREALAEIP
jgi:GntR family transcriptional regulator/MocR family aminotransferase